MRIALASLCLVVFAAGTALAQPQPTPGVLDQVYACANITDEAQRLACYDGAVGRLHEAQNSGNLVAVDRAQAQQVDREAFGFTLPSLGRLFGGGHDSNDGGSASTPARPGFERVDEMDLEVTRVSMRSDGTASFTMSNGQVWSQIDNENPRNVRTGAHVTIRRASLGSYLLHAPSGPALRVRRTQ